jgi:hypothetical protein
MPITRECFINLSMDNQLYSILETLSTNTGYTPPSRECFNSMTLDYQLFQIWSAWSYT